VVCRLTFKLSDGLGGAGGAHGALTTARDARTDGAEAVRCSAWLGHWCLTLKQNLSGRRILDAGNLRCEKEINRILTRWPRGNIRGDMVVIISHVASPANVKNPITMTIEKMND
jgi:hypothetical protein